MIHYKILLTCLFSAYLFISCSTKINNDNIKKNGNKLKKDDKNYLFDLDALNSKIKIPKGWVLVNQNKTNSMSFIQYKRNPISFTGINIVPNFLVTVEPIISKGEDFQKVSESRHLLISGIMIDRGNKLGKNRVEISDEIDKALEKVKEKRTLSIEYFNPKKNENFLVISTLLKINNALLNISFELKPEIFSQLKDEIFSIILNFNE